MYPVSATFHNLAIQDAPKTRCRIYFIADTVDCTDDNDVQTNGTLLVGKAGDTDSNGRIGQDGVKYTQFFNKNKNITIGDSLSSQIEMTLLNYDGALNGFAFGRCKVYIDVWDVANSVWENCPIGVFYIEQPAKTRLSLVTVRGFDAMQKFNAIADTWWSAINWSAGLTCSDLLDLMASNLGLQHATDDTSVLSNTSVTFTSAPFPCVENTYKDILKYIGEFTTANAIIDRDGRIALKAFKTIPVTIDTDTVGNQCLSIDVAEYSVAKIDRLRGIFSDTGTDVTVGSGINEYTVTSNSLFSGPDATETQNRLTQTYNKLNAIPLYHPISGRFIYDWSIDSGDIINIVNDSTTYAVPIFQQTMTWRGGFVVADILSDGDATRPVLGESERDYYRLDTETKTMTIEADRINLLGYTTINNGFKVNLDGTFEANGATINGTVTSNATINGGTNTAEVSGGAFTFKRNNDTLMETSYSSGGMKTEYMKPDGTVIVEIDGYGGPNSGVTVYPPNGSGSSYLRPDTFGVNVNGGGTEFVVDSNGVSVNASPGNEITYNGSSIVLKSYVDSTAANYTVGSNHYVAINYPSGINPTNCVSIGMYSFSSVSGPITLIPYGQVASDTKWYIIGDAGVTLNGVKFRYWYL